MEYDKLRVSAKQANIAAYETFALSQKLKDTEYYNKVLDCFTVLRNINYELEKQLKIKSK